MTDNVRRGVKSCLPILNWLLGYQRNWLSANLVATVTDLTRLVPNSDAKHFPTATFGLAHYNLPESVEALMADNDVALYNLQKDPEEMDNLANPDNPGFDRELLETMNTKLNALIAAEIGVDEPILKPAI